jgi:Rab GDP dissociation inhibitor
LLGDVLEMFVSVSDVFTPTADGSANNLWITESYDSTSHFERASDEILDIYQKIVGEKLDLNIEPDENEEDY